MYKAYKYRIYPNNQQKELIEKTFGVCRLVYNLALEVKMTAYKSAGINLSAYDLINQIPELKKEVNWIAEVDSQAIRQSIINMEAAYKNFFKLNSGYPKFKKKSNEQSFQCPNNTRRVDWQKSTLTIPKIKNIPIVLSRKFEGKIKNITISRTPTLKYFASILVETTDVEVPAQPVNAATTIGIDVGIKSYVVTSDGRNFAPNRKLKDSLTRLKVLQRRASRKKKGSNSRKKTNKKVAILHERITNKRLDYIHKITHELTHDNQVATICVEDLNVSGLLKNHCMAQAINDIALGKFYDILGYKCKWYGINLVKIGRFDPSSKRCSCCGHIRKELTLKVRNWSCEKCGTTHDRDKNAAQNIKYFGLKRNSPEGIGEGPVELPELSGAKKQENLQVKFQVNADHAEGVHAITQ